MLSIAFIVLGLALLVGGGEMLVRGAVALASRAGMSPAVIGLTVVAAGTSMPELVVSIEAAFRDNTAVAVGNVVGSNIFNIAAILGVAAVIAPLRIQGNSVRLEWPVMFLSTGLLYVLARDGSLDRLEGAFFVAGLVVFLAYAVRLARRDLSGHERAQIGDHIEPLTAKTSLFMAVALLAAGIVLLAGGAHLLVRGSVALATAAGLSETVIGLTVVAAGTSLPELATSIVASVRGRDDIAVANVIGSNIFNVLGIAGATALIHPLPIPAVVLARDGLWMLGLSAVLLPLMRSGFRINRLEGGILLAAFTTYMATLLV